MSECPFNPSDTPCENELDLRSSIKRNRNPWSFSMRYRKISGIIVGASSSRRLYWLITASPFLRTTTQELCENNSYISSWISGSITAVPLRKRLNNFYTIPNLWPCQPIFDWQSLPQKPDPDLWGYLPVGWGCFSVHVGPTARYMQAGLFPVPEISCLICTAFYRWLVSFFRRNFYPLNIAHLWMHWLIQSDSGSGIGIDFSGSRTLT